MTLKWLLDTIKFKVFTFFSKLVIQFQALRMETRSSSTLTETQEKHVPDGSTGSAPTLKGAVIKAFFVLGSATLIFESVRNSLTWYLASFWGGAGDVWQTMWESFLVSMVKGLFINRQSLVKTIFVHFTTNCISR